MHTTSARDTMPFSSSSFHSTSLGHLFSDASHRVYPRSINSLVIRPLVFASSLLESAFHWRDLSSLQDIVTALGCRRAEPGVGIDLPNAHY